MDWEAKEKERRDALEAEKKRLLSMSEVEAAELPTPERYQRIRYQREIEAHEWLERERRKLPPMPVAQPVKPKRYSKPTRVYYNQD